jgi:glycopeptide antibiotics resistance protein
MKWLNCLLHRKRKAIYKTLNIIFFIYSCVMIWQVFVGPYRSYSGIRRYNIYPLKTITDYLANSERYNFNILFINLAGNIITFIPLGFFISILFKRFNNTRAIIMFSIVITIIIEAMQFILNVGVFDIDDIILNIVGCTLGYVLHKIMRYGLYK